MRCRIAALAALILTMGQTGARYPAAPRVPVVDTYAHGVRVSDPYRWLEDDGSAAVHAWVARQAAYAQRYLPNRPVAASFSTRIAALSKTSTSRSGLVIANGAWFYQRLTPPQSQPQLIVRDGLGGKERVLYDPATGARGKPAPAIESMFVAPDGSKVAFTTQEGGAEEETLHVVDVATAKMYQDKIAHAGGGTSPSALAWDADERGFIYARWPKNVAPAQAHFNIAIYHHTLGSDPAADTYVFGHGLWRSAEYFFITSLDAKHVALFVEPGDGDDYAAYVRQADGSFAKVADERQGVKDGAFLGDQLLLRTHFSNTRYEVVSVAPGQRFANRRVLVPSSRVVIDSLAVIDGTLFTKDIDGGESRIRAFRADGKPLAPIPLPAHIAVNTIAGEESGKDVVVDFAGFKTPSTWIALTRVGNRVSARPTGIQTRVPGDYSRVVIKRVFVPSIDGTVKIPLTIVNLPGVRVDGSAPTVMTAYGSYGIISEPRFLGSWLNWLEHGGVYAVANIRGGGEYGAAWHSAAVHATVTKRADDLAACAQWLQSHGYGDARHFGIFGGSAGGFLMGMALTRNPSLYRAVNSAVGIYDSLRVELSPNGFFNIPEFGTVKDPAQFAWMYGASPYHHVRKGVAYPAVLMQTGANDPRVSPYQSRKMVAALQYATSSNLPVLLLQKAGQGHGIGSSYGQRVAGAIETQVFFASQLMR